jgi:hypothetical protein
LIDARTDTVQAPDQKPAPTMKRSLPMGPAPASSDADAPQEVASEGSEETIAPTFHSHHHFLKHCEIAALLLNRDDRHEPAVKHHIREALREASDKVAKIPGDKKQTAQYMSKDALAQMQGGSAKGLIGEHIYPVSRLNVLVFEDAERRLATTESIAAILAARTLRAVITEAEDKKLRALGLHKTMPKGSIDPKARYAAAGIRSERILGALDALQVSARSSLARSVQWSVNPARMSSRYGATPRSNRAPLFQRCSCAPSAAGHGSS